MFSLQPPDAEVKNHFELLCPPNSGSNYPKSWDVLPPPSEPWSQSKGVRRPSYPMKEIREAVRKFSPPGGEYKVEGNDDDPNHNSRDDRNVDNNNLNPKDTRDDNNPNPMDLVPPPPTEPWPQERPVRRPSYALKEIREAIRKKSFLNASHIRGVKPLIFKSVLEQDEDLVEREYNDLISNDIGSNINDNDDNDHYIKDNNIKLNGNDDNINYNLDVNRNISNNIDSNIDSKRESNSNFLNDLRSQLEGDLLKGVYAPLSEFDLSDSMVKDITDELSLMLHIKVKLV
jgi:hypothetical protein